MLNDSVTDGSWPMWLIDCGPTLCRVVTTADLRWKHCDVKSANLLANTTENVAKWIENPGHMKPGVLMPDLGVRGEQSKALAAYLLSLK